MIARAVSGSLVLLLLLFLAIFLPAGTMRYWQAWVHLAVFAGCRGYRYQTIRIF